MVACVALACLFSAAIGVMAGWTDTSGSVAPVVLAAACFFVGAAPALAMASSAWRSRTRNFGLFVALGGGLRVVLSVFAAVAVFLIASPEGRLFWTCFLLAGLGGLAAETAWAMGAARSMGAGLGAGDRTGEVPADRALIPAESTGAVP